MEIHTNFFKKHEKASRINELDHLEDMNQVDFGFCILNESSIKTLAVVI
jgi:hypothetical protein